ncbi:hypothetical protein GCM10027167_10920 [Nocardia heshunensis]
MGAKAIVAGVARWSAAYRLTDTLRTGARVRSVSIDLGCNQARRIGRPTMSFWVMTGRLAILAEGVARVRLG